MRRALVLWAGAEFKGSCAAVVRHLERERFSCQSTDVGEAWSSTQLWIDEYPNLMQRADLIVVLSHGGWDGPMIFGGTRNGLSTSPQIGRHYSNLAWPAVCRWFRNMLTSDGLAMIHACHSAGSNRYESTDGGQAHRWVEELSSDARIYTVGVEGVTSSAIGSQSVALLKHALRGSAPPQAARAYQPGGRQAARWGGWLNLARR